MRGFKVPILTYHSLDDSGSVISMPPAKFREQMWLLAAHRFTGIRFDELAEAWKGRGTLPERPVVLTFDDAFANVLEHAVPVLSGLGFRATIFAVAGQCGRFNEWPQQSGVPHLPLLSFADLAQLSADGFEIGAHSLTHARLSELAPEPVRREIVESRQILQDGIGTAVSTFAYPFGLVSPMAVEIVRRHYRAACSTRLATARRCDDRHLLPRIEMYYWRVGGLFQLFGTSLGTVYLRVRALGRRIREALGKNQS
jgi:peptidoglycan/xylan/chitin deacetylase (PgdA/CDA1 family)